MDLFGVGDIILMDNWEITHLMLDHLQYLLLALILLLRYQLENIIPWQENQMDLFGIGDIMVDYLEMVHQIIGLLLS